LIKTFKIFKNFAQSKIFLKKIKLLKKLRTKVKVERLKMEIIKLAKFKNKIAHKKIKIWSKNKIILECQVFFHFLVI
jgi:hypothetical protein